MQNPPENDPGVANNPGEAQQAQDAGQVVRLGWDLRFSDRQFEDEFAREQAETYQHLDAGWAALSTTLILLLVPRLFEQASHEEILLGCSALPMAISPLYFYRYHHEFWLRHRGKLLGAVRLYKSILAIYLSKYYVQQNPVKDWPHLFRYLLLNGRLAVLLHLSVGMRVMFSEFLLIQGIVLALLLPLAPDICQVKTPLHIGPVPLHDIFIRIGRFMSWATTLLAVVPYGLKGFPDRACVEVLTFLQILVGLVIPGILLYVRERRWRCDLAALAGVRVENRPINRLFDHPIASGTALLIACALLWQFLETLGLALV
ncbi:hypothetical protein WJX72_002623 [[Myrmecia] bisecta]|uniref:Uncharacterized protein n=1 Tax=[Myrmecia] bisecta TaxID=41462 RepID=A0AAW1PJN8_9CHLO